MSRAPRAVEPLLAPAAFVYRSLMEVRNVAFDRDWFRAQAVGRPVISIGNLTAGGTGKTPLTAYLIKELIARGLKPGIVSRGYGGNQRTAAVVPSERSNAVARRYGDETSWFASEFKSVPVVVAPKRVEGARLLVSSSVNNIDLIIADDAFQHRWLERSIDFVLLDATEPRWHYRPLPLGRLREGFRSLQRANAVFITKTNLADPEQERWLRDRVIEHAPHLRDRIFDMESRLTGFTGLTDGRPVAGLQGKRILLMSAIGRPPAFELSVREAGGTDILEHVIFRDHHGYSREDLARIESRARELKIDLIVTTEKDSVKLSGWAPAVPVAVSRLEMRPKMDIGVVYEDIRRLVV